MQTLTIAEKYHGPPNSGNGGYSCGKLDNFTNYVSEVTLRKPVPLDVAMVLLESDGELALLHEQQLIASVKPGKVDIEIPSPPDFATAAKASDGFSERWRTLAFPTCFVCGHDREPGAGLRLCTGRIDQSDVFATTWQPDKKFANTAGLIRPEFMWAALDCPGAFALMADEKLTVVLGRMTTEIKGTIKAEESCIITAWVIQSEGRKHHCGTALYNAEGNLAAVAKAVWFEI